MAKINSILISIDFRSDKGGISRVANLMYKAFPFDQVLSLHGNGGSQKVSFFNGNRLFFLIKVLYILIFKRPDFVAFDHLNIARVLIFIPKSLLKKIILFVYDEEVWIKVTGLRRAALEKTTNILCISNHSMQKFLKCNPELKNKTKLCLLAGVPEKFLKEQNTSAINYQEWFSDHRPYCIFVSRLWKVHRYKGHFELLEAYKEYYKKYPTASLRLAIIGNGDDAIEVESFIKNEKLEKIVTLFKGLSDDDLVQFYKNSIALVFPSTREGFGFVFLEAMFFKKACIGITDQPAEEIIINGKTGELLQDNDPETLVNVLLDIEKNPVKYKNFGESGYLRYKEYFTNDHFKERFLNSISYLIK